MDSDRALDSLLLVGTDAALLAAWAHDFAAWPEVEVVAGSVEDVVERVDAVVSPGNSYGEMGGGVDLALRARFPLVQAAVRRRIAEAWRGYQPVGTADLVPTGDPRCRWLVHAPTMRVPMPLEHGRDVAVHDALWAALLAVEAHNAAAASDLRVRSLACPGLGTGHGRVPPRRASQLMAAAYRCWREPVPGSASDREEVLGAPSDAGE